MEKSIFSPMEIDAIGEIMNISLGSSATAVSNMLDNRVDITTPQVSVIDAKDFSLATWNLPSPSSSSMSQGWRAATSCCSNGVTSKSSWIF